MAYRYFKALEIVTQNEVNYARNRVGAIGSGSTFFQDFYALKCRHGDRGRINEYRAIVCHGASDRLTLTIYEHQGRR